VRTEGGRPPSCSSSRIAEGTVLIRVTWSRAGRDGNSRTLRARMTVPPWQRGANSSKTDKSKLIDVDASVPASSSGPNSRPAHASNADALRCSMETAFGRPVDPDV
jgi:hypothetical protein